MIKIKAICVVLSFIIALSSAAIFDCEYKMTSHATIGNSYTCHARVLKLALIDNVINGITQNHMRGKNGSDVTALVIQNQNCEEFLQEIEIGFPNLEGIIFTNSHLKTIEGGDLKPFTKLKYLNLANNDLEELPSDLFESNLELVHIDFQHNKIRHIGPHILDSLNNLQRVYFHNNICISRNIDSEAQVAAMKHDLARNCPATLGMLETLLVNGNLLTKLIEALKKKDNELEARVFQIETFLNFYRN